MRVLYYCPEYFSNHGARTHAREFFHALQNSPGVAEAFIYDERPKSESDASPHVAKKTGGRTRFLPKSIKRFFHFWKPKNALTQSVLDELKANACDVLIVRSGTRIPSLQEIKRQRPDLLVCLEINSAFFDEFYANIPFRRFIQNMEVKRFSYADSFFTVSRYLKEYLLERGLPDSRVLINQNAVNTEVFRPLAKDLALTQELNFNIPADAFVLGYVGGMEVFRRLPEVIDLFSELRVKGHKQVFLLMIGDGVDRQAVEARIKANAPDISGWITCLGWQPYENIPRLISLFDVAIFPFTNPYCSPLKLFEYLAMEKAVLGPDTPAVREVFTEGEHVSLVKEDGSDFCDKVIELITSSSLRSNLAENGKQRVIENYTWEKNASGVLDHIRSCSFKD